MVSWSEAHMGRGVYYPEADINAIFLNVTPLVDLRLACHIFS